MTDLARLIAEHQRLIILRLLTDVPPEETMRRQLVGLLAQAPGGTANLSILQEVLVGEGAHATREAIAAELGWLADRGLIRLDQGGPVVVAHLTDRGSELAAGLADLAGVQSLPTIGWLRDGMEKVGVVADTHQVEDACGWLITAGLVTLDETRCTIWPLLPVAAEVATGRRVCEGVRTPGRSAIMSAAANAAKDRLGR